MRSSDSANPSDAAPSSCFTQQNTKCVPVRKRELGVNLEQERKPFICPPSPIRTLQLLHTPATHRFLSLGLSFC